MRRLLQFRVLVRNVSKANNLIIDKDSYSLVQKKQRMAPHSSDECLFMNPTFCVSVTRKTRELSCDPRMGSDARQYYCHSVFWSGYGV